jgi:hypothetical protein
VEDYVLTCNRRHLLASTLCHNISTVIDLYKNVLTQLFINSWFMCIYIYQMKHASYLIEKKSRTTQSCVDNPTQLVLLSK